MLDVVGHRQWAYLNGGIDAWSAAGRRVETGGAAYGELSAVVAAHRKITFLLHCKIGDAGYEVQTARSVEGAPSACKLAAKMARFRPDRPKNLRNTENPPAS